MPRNLINDFFYDVDAIGSEKAWAKHLNPKFEQYNKDLTNFLVQNEKSINLEQEQTKQRNINYNSLLALSKQAGESDTYASSLFNRINNVSNLGYDEGSAELKSISDELNNLQEKATTNQYGGIDKLADFASGLKEYVIQPYMKARTKVLGSLGEDYIKKLDLDQYLKNTTPDLDSLKIYSTPDQLKSNYVDKLVGQQRELLKLPKLVQNYGSVDKILNEIEATDKSPNRANAFDNLALSTLDLDFKTPGSDFYRDANSNLGLSGLDKLKGYYSIDASIDNLQAPEKYVKDFQDKMRSIVKSDPTKSFYNDDNFVKYDLEKKAIDQRKAILHQELNSTLALAEQETQKTSTGGKAKENPIYKSKIDRINNSLNILVKREQELDNSLYGVKTGDRMGAGRALFYSTGQAIAGSARFIKDAFISPTGERDAEITRDEIGGYKPEVISYDKYGNPVLSNQVFYETKTGSKTNWGGFFESGFKMVGDMVPVILVTKGLGGALSRVAAAEAGAVEAGTAARTGWATATTNTLDKINKFGVLPKNVPLVGGPLRVADRALTMASVYPTVYDKIYREELKWGGNVEARTRALSFNEALTEGLGFPEVGGLKVTGYRRGLGAAVRTATDIPLTRTQRYLNFMRGGAEVAKNAVKINFLESMEEEMALFGEYMIAKGYEEDYNKVGRDKPTMDGASVIDTFLESFKGGLIYSGFNAGMRHYQITRPDALRDYARYEAAQNPELFKAKLVADFKKNPGKMSEKDLQNGLIEIDNLSTLFKSLGSLDNLKDLNTFLDDEDARFQLFTKADFRNTLINFDYESLTDEQKEELSQYKLMSAIAEKGEKKLSTLKTRTAELTQKAQTEELSPEEKKELTQGQVEYIMLKGMSRYKYLNKRDLSNEQIKYLTEQGIVRDNDFQFTKEDLDKMISEVDTSILKTEKRAFQYASMTEQQKREKIKEMYDQKIEVINQMTNPSAVNDSLTAITKDYEYLDKNVNGLNEELMSHKKRLLDAYRNRLDQLTTPTENGRTTFENELAETNLEEITNTNDIATLSAVAQRLEQNKDFVDRMFLSNTVAKLDLVYETIINNLSKLEGQSKLDALLPIFDKLVKQSPAYFYEASRLNGVLTTENNITAAITPEEFETLRDNLMELRGKRRSQSLAETGRYDNVDTPVQGTQTNVIPEEDDLSKIVRKIKNANTEVDESGKSERSEGEQEYINRITAGKTPAQVVQIIKNLVKGRFNENSTNARNIRAAIDKYTQDRDKAAFDLAMRNIEAGIEKEISNLQLTNPNSKRIETLQDALDNMVMWKKTMDKLVRNKANTFEPAPQQPGTQPGSQQGKDEAPPGVNGKLTNEETDEVILTGDDKILLESLDSAELARRQRLLELTSALRTAAVEVSGNNVRNTDPVVQRRVRQLDSLAGQPIVYTKIMNRRQYVREAIAARFPEKKNQEINDDLALIDSLFATSNLTKDTWDSMSEEQKDEFLAPMNTLLGKNFFDNYDLESFITNKGRGLINTPNVVVALADEKGKLAFIEGYPAEFNFTAETTLESRKAEKLYPNVPWRISQRVTESGKNLAVSEADVLKEHKEGFQDRQSLIKYLQNSDDTIPVTAEITEGVLIGTKDNQLLVDIPTENLTNPLQIEDFQLAENLNNAIFGKNYKFSLGRLYYNNNGNPLILGNVNITKEEAETLADLVFSNDPSVITPGELKDYLYTIINQIGEDRLLFYEGDTYGKTDDAGNMIVTYAQLVNPVKKVGKEKGKKLTREEFIKELTGRFYKVDRKYLTDGERDGEKILVFRKEQQPDGNFKIVKAKQPYLEYLKRTHTFPMTAEGGLNQLVNKTLYLDKNEVSKAVKTKKLVQPAPVPSMPATPTIKTKKTQYKREDFPDSQDNTRTLITQKLLDYFAEVLDIPKFTEDLSKGTYIEWLRNANNTIGYNVSNALNAPKKAFDIIAQYESELVDFEQQNTKTTLSTTSTSLIPRILDEFSILPLDQVSSVLGLPSSVTEGNYTAGLASLKMNPSNLKSVQILSKSEDNQITLTDYEPGLNIPNTIGYLLRVKVGDKLIALSAVKDANLNTIGKIQVTGTANNVKFNVATVEGALTPKKMSIEDLSNAVNETSQKPFDNTQVEQAKEEKEACATTTNRLSDFKRQRGPLKK